jgi:hypothetical protein
MIAPGGVSFRALRSTAIAAILFVGGIACAGDPSVSATYTPTRSTTASCASGERACLAWDDFDRSPGPVVDAPSGQAWETWTIFYPEFHPVFTTDGSRASMAPGADHGQVWLATIDSGRATGIRVSADITM